MLALPISKLLTPLQLIAAITTVSIGGITLIRYLSSDDAEAIPITGNWVMTLEPTESSVEDYIGDVYQFEVNVFKEDGKIRGRGEQTMYNGNTASKHFQLEFQTVTVTDSTVAVLYTMQGNRPYDVRLKLRPKTTDGQTLIGSYSTPMAKTKGKAKVVIQH